MLSVPLGRIRGGIADGIEVVDLPKHLGIDPNNYRDRRALRRDTNPFGRGSKWLVHISRAQRFEMIRQVLEDNGASLDGEDGVFRSELFDAPVGVSNGEWVFSVEVRFDGRYAHGYPCAP